MKDVGLAVLGIVLTLSGAPAWGQAPKPSYGEALAAVSEAGCQRKETERYIKFFCEEGDALWYFTREGRPEHAAYLVAPVHSPFGATRPRERMSFSPPIFGGDRIPASSREEAAELSKARVAWAKDIQEVWRRDAARMEPKPKRDRGKLYPLEP